MARRHPSAVCIRVRACLRAVRFAVPRLKGFVEGFEEEGLLESDRFAATFCTTVLWVVTLDFDVVFFFATGFFATIFLTAAFFTTRFLATGFLATVFFTTRFLAAGFLATVFLTTFLATVLFTLFLATGFLAAVVFFTTRFLAAGRLLAGFVAPDLAAQECLLVVQEQRVDLES